MTDSTKRTALPSTATGLFRRCLKPSLVFFVIAMAAGLIVGRWVAPTWTVERVTLDAQQDPDGKLWYTFKKKPKEIEDPVPLAQSRLNQERIAQLNASGGTLAEDERKQYVSEVRQIDGKPKTLYYHLTAQRHWGW